MPKLPGILFDMDGVLLDSEPVITRAAIEGLKRYGVEAQPEDFKPFTGMGENRFIGGVAEKYGVAYRTEMKDTVYDLYGDIVDAELYVYPATLPTLRALRELGHPMALASAADHVKIAHNLRVAGIRREDFDVLLGGEDATHKKPHPEIYLKAAQGLGLDPAQCVVVEDALSGVQAAKAAGCRCIAVTSSFPAERLREAGADDVIEDIGGLVEAIGRLGKA